MTGKRLVSAAEAARRLGVHRSTMTRWIAQGLVPAERTIGGQWRIRATWVDYEAGRLASVLPSRYSRDCASSEEETAPSSRP